MAKIIPIGEPVNDAERQAISHLRDQLPDTYTIVHNFEVRHGAEKFEIDIAVIAPHGVYLVDAKGTHGQIEVAGPKWYPEGRQPYTSPLLKLRSHAKVIKGVIVATQSERRQLNDIYVDAVIVLTAPGASLNDPSGRDGPDVVSLKKCAVLLQDLSRVPNRYSTNISAFQSTILKAIQGVARRRTGPLRFGNWEVSEKLGGTDICTEYRAFNLFAGPSSGHVRLHVYKADPYLPAEQREAQRKRIGNAYEALSRLPVHPNIVAARDFFATQDEDGYVLVTDDVGGRVLRFHIDKPPLALTLDQKLAVAKGLLSGLEHAHLHGVVHRNLNPSCLMLGEDGQLRISGFDFARAGIDRTHTIAEQIVNDLDPTYMAPEVQGEPAAASLASDVFSAGLVLYEMFVGERPFKNQTEVFDLEAVFPQKPSQLRSELSPAFDAWLQQICIFDPDKRITARAAREEMATLTEPAAATSTLSPSPNPPLPIQEPALDYSNLDPGTQITSKYVVEKRLGRPGSFGVVYKVVDTLGDVPRAMKLILRDRHSTLERLKKEYRTLLRTPEHPNVVRVFDADILPGGGPPFIVFEFVNGLDVGEMIETGVFSPDDVIQLGRQVAAGLVHLHGHGVYHCDIKPRNLLWTETGAKIIDFNVSVLASTEEGHGGGSRHYLPPDLDLSVEPTPAERGDRDCYALGLTLYEALTGRYPWETAVPPVGRPAPDPRESTALNDLSPELAETILKAIAPKRGNRFSSSAELLAGLTAIKQARRIVVLPRESSTAWTEANLGQAAAIPPNTNPYVSYLLTLYSQSTHSNSGTRGLDRLGRKLYVDTALDRDLVPSALGGLFNLIIITGNAGDGKTAFLQKLEDRARELKATFDEPLPNGARFTFKDKKFITNYDGSQDEGEQQSDHVLREFFMPFAGNDLEAWPKDDVRLIAINEGRLVDFLSTASATFEGLSQVVMRGLATGQPESRVAVVNLNLRSVVADAEKTPSILERLLKRMTRESLWKPCEACDLKDRCYALHNAKTFQDETAGPKVVERLKMLYTLTHLRGRLHITVRDLGSALAYTLVGTRDCGQIHSLYQGSKRDEIIQGYYFNSWMGGDQPTSDRLLSLMRDIDIGQADDPRLDRTLDFVSPTDDRGLFTFEKRGRYDRDVLRRLFDDLPRDFTGRAGSFRGGAHQQYIAMARRRAFFERRDSGWKSMLPYATSERMVGIIRGKEPAADALREVLDGINRGEGLTQANGIRGSLALQVRHVENGTIRSYRLFQAGRFTLSVQDESARASFVEHMPSGLVLGYRGTGTGGQAEMMINLDVFEMLLRLNDGYRPSIEEEQGYYLSLAVFKNILGSAPYQEVLLTVTGHEFYRVERHPDGRLQMSPLTVEVG
jgi:serine/threonine protein kinase